MNFIQLLARQSPAAATCLIEQRIPQLVMDQNSVHSSLVAMFVMMRSPKGAQLCLGSGFFEQILLRFYSHPLLSLFSSSFLLFLFSSKLPRALFAAKLKSSNFIHQLICTAFKSVVKFQEYQALLRSTFECLSYSSASLETPMLVENFFNQAMRFIDDSLGIVLTVAGMGTALQMALANELGPLIHLMSDGSRYSVLTSHHLCLLISICHVTCGDFIAKERLKCERLIAPLVTFSYCRDPQVFSASVRCLARILRDSPRLCELAAASGLCLALSGAAPHASGAPECLAELICAMPGVSAFTAHKMKEAGLFATLVDLVCLGDWQAGAVAAIARWAAHDPRYVDAQLSRGPGARRLYPVVLGEIDRLRRPRIRAGSLAALAALAGQCPAFARRVLDARLVAFAAGVIEEAGDGEKAAAIDFLMRLALQAADPAAVAAGLWPHLRPYAESPAFPLQRAALRMRIIASCRQSSPGKGQRHERPSAGEVPQGAHGSHESPPSGRLRVTNSRIGANGENDEAQPGRAKLSDRKRTSAGRP
jgi:hypothetical protein